MAYARHQSFYLRDKWFSKGLRALEDDNRFFYDSYAFEKIGLGKNMLESLKYWLLAFRVIEETNIDGQKKHTFTELGKLIYERDRLLQLNDTLSILHYNLVRNSDNQSTVFEWYFNTYMETVTSKQELVKSFITWVSKNEPKEVSEKSLKRDIDCLVQAYTKLADENDPEDTIFCPFSRMALLKTEPSGEGHDIIKKRSPSVEHLGINSLYFVLLDYCYMKEIELISVQEIIEEDFLWGKVFNLTRNRIIEALNILTNNQLYPIHYVRTNNIDYIRVPNLSPMEFLITDLYLLSEG